MMVEGGAGGRTHVRRIRFLADHDFRDSIVEGLRRERPDCDILMVRDAGLLHRPDPDLLAYAQQHGRMLLTHDKRTMPGHMDDFVRALPHGEHSPGGFLVPQRMAIGPAIQELLLIWEASEPDEWRDCITFLPL
jgi:Domain of unknown function (DUF5615)